MLKAISLLLILVIAVTFLAGCQENSADVANDEKSGNTGVNLNETTSGNYESEIEYLDLGGYEISFVVRGGTGGYASFYCIDLFSEGYNGDLINDAVYERNLFLEEKYNFKIKQTYAEHPTFPSDVLRNSVLAQEDVYDVAYDSLSMTMPMAGEQMLTDIYTLPYINFSKPYWYENVNEDLSIGNKLYMTYGEHMLSVNAGLYGVFFNKQIADDFNIENLYDAVRNNKWTIEKYYNLCKDIAYDYNGDGIMDYHDFWGTQTQMHNAYTFFIASGEKIVSKDENDYPVLSLNNPRAINVLELTGDFLMDTNTTMQVNSWPQDVWGYIGSIFKEERSLFVEGAIMQAPAMRNWDFDFGILPNPKYEENQDRYYHTPSVWNTSLLAVPATITNPDKIGYILEILAAKSVDTLTPTYYDLQLTNKVMRDDESGKMLDIMFSSVAFDIGAAYDFGGMFNVVLNVGTKAANFASAYAAAEGNAQKAIDKLIETLEGE